jgi:hypothetical protein
MLTSSWARKLFGRNPPSRTGGALPRHRLGRGVVPLEDRVVPAIVEHVIAGGVLEINPISDIFPAGDFARMEVLTTTVPGLNYGVMGRLSDLTFYPWGSGPPNPFGPATVAPNNQNRIFAGQGFEYISNGTGVGQSDSIPIRFSNTTGFNTQTDTLVIDIDAPPAPTIVSQPQGQSIQAGQSATLSVTATSNTPLSYQWYGGASGDTTHPVAGATGRTYTTPAFTTAQQASYWVRVTNSTGPVDSATAVVTVAGATPTTTAAGDATATYSPADQSVTLQATVTGGTGSLNVGTVTFTVAGVGTASAAVSNGLAAVTLTAPGGTHAGTYTIQASYSGPTGYSPSSDTRTLTVRKATPAVTWANPAAITYGTPLGAGQLNAAADVPGSFAYTPASGTVLHAGPGQSLSATFTPADTTDYTGATRAVSVTVDRAILTVTADDKSRPYFTPNPALTVRFSGFVNGDGPTTLTAPPVLATAANPASLPGTYPITVGGAAANDYAVAFVPGTLTVLGLPDVVSVQVNDGTAQRSEVTGLTITFAGTVYAVPPGSIAITSGGTTLVPTAFVVSGNRVTVQFTGLPGLVNGSLPDGRYTLVVGGKNVAQFTRLFGDSSGDGQVNDTDLAAFRGAFRTRRGMAGYQAFFDFNNDGVIDATDYNQFLMRYGTQV